MDFQVLGPVRAFDGGVEVDLGGPKQRLVLAILLAAHGASVSTDGLIEGLWSDAPPATARKTLQGYVHHLRNTISGGLETDKAGYSLGVRETSVDERRFTAVVAEAKPLCASQPERASELLTVALALWQGNPYADLDGAPVLLPEIARLTETRLVALGDRIEADLALGREASLIGELESLTVDYPLQERFRGLHMVALYRAGRHGEALRAFARTRTLFIEEMGIEPSDQLKDLERRVLDHDPELDAAVEETPGVTRAIRGYEMREQISTDASGALFRGYQRSVGREVAIRVTGAEIADDPLFIARYESDVAMVANLDHPNIVYVQDTWREPGRAYEVMQWIDGQRLDCYLAEQRPGTWEALKILDGVSDALACAHRGGVVHGDVRASAVLRPESGNVYLTDFVVGRPAGVEADDRAAFTLLAFHVIFGVQPKSMAEAGELLHSTVTSPELLFVFEEALAAGGCRGTEELVRGIRRVLGGDVVELADERDTPLRSGARCPYKGLQAFQTTDNLDFFGRDDLVERLHELVMRRRLVAVVGPSGAGKSSIVKAGLAPRLSAGTDPVVLAEMYPGAYPFDALARALRSVAVRDEPVSDRLLADHRGLSRVVDSVLPDDGTELVLVIDQFEEVFATVASESLRSLFLDSLVTAATDPGSRLRVVITLRADFFDRPLRYAAFGGLVEAGLVPLPMPDDAGLAAAIERPAAAVGVGVQPGLVGEMVRDVAGEPGGLPLLQYALTDIFVRRESDLLTIEDYHAVGGVLGALATRAEALFTELDPTGQRAMQQAFLHMVSVDEGADHVRHRVTRADLRALEVDENALDEGLKRFGAHRLLTFDSDPVSRAPTVEVAHESLLGEWDRLSRWIDEKRDQLVVRKRLDAALQEWEESREDSGYLLRGRRLAQFDGWAAGTDMALSTRERAFLQASREHDEEQARTASSRRRRVMLALAVAAAVAVAFGLYALIERNQAADEAHAAETARLGNESGFVVEHDRQMGLLMAAETFRRDPGYEGRSALQRALVDAGPFLGNLGAGQRYGEARWVTNDRLLGVTDDEVHLFDAPTGIVTVLPIEVLPADARSDSLGVLRASTPAGLAAVAAAGGRIMMVDVTDGGVEPFTPADDSRAMAISADGTTVAIGRDDGTLEIVDRESGVMTASVLAHAAGGIDGTQLDPAATPDDFEFEGVDQLTFDPSGEKVSSAAAVFLRSWNVDDLSPAGPEIVNAWGEDDFNLVAARPATFWHDKAEPDVLVVAGDSFVARWRMSTGQRVSLDAVGASLVGAASAGDGSILLLADDGRVVRRALDGVGTGESFTSGADFVFDTQERVVSELTVNDDRSRLAVATDDGVVTAALDGSRIAARAVPIGSSDNPTLTRDGTTLAAGLASDGLFDLTVEPPAQRRFDVHVEIAESAGSPANFELTAAGDDDVLVWTSTFMDMRNAYDLESGDYLGDLWGPYVPAWTDDGRRIARRARAGGTVVTEANSDRDGYSNQRPMTSGDFDAAGGHLILVFADGAPAVVIDLESGDERPLPDMPGGIVSAAFTPDDDQIVAQGASGAMWVIDARTLQRVYELEEGDVAKGPVIAPPVISADGTMLFSAADGAARLWHLPSGRQIGEPLPAEQGGRSSGIADGEVVRVVTPMDDVALIWNLDVGDWLELACAGAGRNMTEAEWELFGPRDASHGRTCPDN